eukprot:scaffold288976_cov17-Prasinocladus_malaysianus.AAC.1
MSLAGSGDSTVAHIRRRGRSFTLRVPTPSPGMITRPMKSCRPSILYPYTKTALHPHRFDFYLAAPAFHARIRRRAIMQYWQRLVRQWQITAMPPSIIPGALFFWACDL